MIDNLDELIARYRKAGILVDTNLLLLLFMGSFQPTRITTFKRTQQFVEADFQLLVMLLGYFDKIITTPNILTEVSNLSGQLGGDLKLAYFLSMVDRIAELDEYFTASRHLATQWEFAPFGLTDTGIAHLAQGHCLVLTDDYRLAAHLLTLGVDAINFNHLRTYLLE